MLTLRPLPRASHDHPDPLLRIYYRQLRAHWRPAQRLAAAALDRVLAGRGDAFERAFFGIEAPEWRLVDGRVSAAHYVSMRVRKGIHRLLNPAALPLGTSLLKDKRRFDAFARRRGLAIPASCVDNSAVDPWLAIQGDFLLKPNFSSKGRGIARFTRTAREWRCDRGTTITPDAMRSRLRKAMHEGAIVQATIATHPALAAVSPGALPTLRIVTLRDDAGAPVAAAHILRLGGGAAPVDNFNRGGLAASVDAAGAVRPMMRASTAGLAAVDRHPANGSALPRQIPVALFRDAQQLALAAHHALCVGHNVVGWDIGLGADGPVLIEGNWNPGTDVMQLLDGTPLSAQPAGALYCAALERVPPALWAAAAPIQRDHR